MDLAAEVIAKRTQSSIDKLSPSQRRAYDAMRTGRNVFITGPGGTGKSSVVKLFVKANPMNRKIALTSTTGSSAVLIGGATLHSHLGIGLGTGSVSSMLKGIRLSPFIERRWIDIDVLIIDEISMMKPELFDKLEEVARIVRGNGRVFGGIQIILSGDMCQLPCVMSDSFCFQAKSWSRVIDGVIYLSEIIRQRNVEFQRCLNSIRMGDITEEVVEVIGGRIGVELNNPHGILPTKLYPLNEDVDKINREAIDALVDDGAELYEYVMEVRGVRGTLRGCLAPEILHICVGAQVMLLCNLDVSKRLANGSRGVVIGFDDSDFPMVRFLDGQVRTVGYHDWHWEENGRTVYASQVPLKPAYAISIHKSQGCSLDWVMVDLSRTFTFGQAYVALSRVKCLEGLSITDIDWELVRAHPEAVKFYTSLVDTRNSVDSYRRI